MHVGYVRMSKNLRLVTLRLVTGHWLQLSRTKSQCKGNGEVTSILHRLGELCHIQIQLPKTILMEPRDYSRRVTA
jgi:hypothetical protein